MSETNAFTPVEMIHFDTADLLVGTYKVINELGLDHKCNFINLTNCGKNSMTLSFDGVTDHEFLTAGGRLDIYTLPRFNKGNFRKYSKLYVRGPASIGWLYLAAYGLPNIV